MRRYSATYFVGQSLKGLWKNGVMTIASVLVLLSCLVVMGSFSSLVININENMDKLGVLNEIVVFINADKSDEELTGMYQTVLGFHGVDRVTVTKKEEALAEEKARLAEAGYSYLVESLNEENNPYRPSFVISYNNDASLEDLQYNLNHVDGIEKVQCRADIAQTFSALRSGVSVILGWFMLMLFIVSIFVIINTIKLAVYSRRNEITVMRYIGATKSFITIPFIFEGVIIGLISSVGAFFAQKVIYSYVFNMIGTEYRIITMIPFAKISTVLLLAFLALGVLTGVVGSCISLRKYLKA